MGANRGRPILRAVDPGRTIAVIGFPRSGNTYLTAWLQWLARPEVAILDGRLTHSALDLHRLAKAGTSVVLPIRPALPTCASLLVRWDGHLDLGTARVVLRAYRAWYESATRTLANSAPGIVTVARFEEFTADPECVAEWPGVSPLLDRERMATSKDFEQDLHERLAVEEGQGVMLDGIPGSQMISIPDPDREPLLEQARQLLASPALARHLQRAQDAYEQLAAGSYALSRTPSAMDAPGK